MVFGCFLVSGATGLVYQVVWLRMLGLVFGHTVYAIATILAIFMGGLGIGSWLFARRAVLTRDSFRLYGVLEIAIGGYCMFLPWLFSGVTPLYVHLHRALGLSYEAVSLVQCALVGVLLLPPTILMGGTLPVLSQAIVTEGAAIGRRVGALYAVNTWGAVAGAMLAGYGLLPTLGNRATVSVAAAANIGVGILAIAWSRRAGVAARGGAATSGTKGLESPPGGPGARAARWRQGTILFALAVSGAVSMAYEVGWSRALTLVIGSSTYAFTAMLVAFLTGIAAGSALYARWRGARASLRDFGVLQAGIGVCAALTLLAFERLPTALVIALGWADSPAFVQALQVAFSTAVLLPATLLIGATFPCAVGVVAHRVARAGQDVGHTYALNTLGAIVGSLLAGFVLIQTSGVHQLLRLAIAANLVLAALCLVVDAPAALRRWIGAGALTAAAWAVLVAIPAWNQGLMTSAPAVYAKHYLKTSPGKLRETLRGQEVVFYRDGLTGTVSVGRTDSQYTLRVNGKADAGTGTDLATQLALGHLPMLAHPDPRRALVIGLGSGITAGAVATYPLERLAVAEIEPAVVDASRFFNALNGEVLADSRVRLIVADARNYLLTTPERYDVIVSEPSNPWISGLASLFTLEFFELARDRLEPGGVMVQWVQGYHLSPDDLRMVIRTFMTVFPETELWAALRADYILVGRTAPGGFDLHRLRKVYETNERARDQLRRIGLNAWPSLLGWLVLRREDLVTFAGGAPLNTDDLLPLEFSAPRSMYRDTVALNWDLVRSSRRAWGPVTTPESRPELDRPEVQVAIAALYLKNSDPREALARLETALAVDADFGPALILAASASLVVGRPDRALHLAQRALARDPDNPQARRLAANAGRVLDVLREQGAGARPRGSSR